MVVFFHKDANVSLEFSLKNPDGTTYNLTDASVSLLVKPERGSTITKTAVVTNANEGKATVTIGASTFSAGPYSAQVRVTSGPIVLHSQVFRIMVAEAIE